MEVVSEPLPGVFELQARVFDDDRGSFSETFNRRTMAGLGLDHEFVQDNESFSASEGTIRGLHFQVAPHAQGKLVRVLQGAILDVAVDIRPGSPTYTESASVELAAGDHRCFWVPPGFAHGFCTLTDATIVAYKVTSFYAPDHERSIRFDDPDLGIDWPTASADAVLSAKDAAAPSFAEFERQVG